MNVYEIDPTTDERWENLLQNHPQASIFHTRGWLDALRRTYGYSPVVFTTSPPRSPLTNGIAFCKVKGLLGKQRLVSLPFSDHCDPLVENDEQLIGLLAHLRQKRDAEGWDYVELRAKDSLPAGEDGFGRSQCFALHQLDLRRDLDDILSSTHKDCIQRKIRRAEREALVCDYGTSESILHSFYRLLVATRRRHGLPAQPIAWFQSLIACMDKKLMIRVAFKGSTAIAAILTLQYKDALVYKYGCSDHKFNKLGGIQLLLWHAIQDAKREGQCWLLDMGRSDYSNSGLVIFKDRWKANQTQLSYLRYPLKSSSKVSGVGGRRLARYLCRHAPPMALSAAGRALYKYAG